MIETITVTELVTEHATDVVAALEPSVELVETSAEFIVVVAEHTPEVIEVA